jgi:hypothetical protein
MNFDMKAMAVQPPALVSGSNIRQPVRRLDRELLENLH